MSGEQDLQRMIDSLNKLGDLGTEAAPECAREIRAIIEGSIDRAEDPYGGPWKPRQQDGAKALQNAEQSLYVAAVGTSIWLRLKGPTARHHQGKGSGHVKRPVIPDKPKLPDPIFRAITQVIERHFQRAAAGK